MKILILLFVLFTSLAWGKISPWDIETEASLVQVRGNVESETYSVKEKILFNMTPQDEVSSKGRYVTTNQSQQTTALAWDLSLRYRHIISPKWSGFAQKSAESNAFSGYELRDLNDMGLRYEFIKTKTSEWYTEFGGRYRINKTTDDPHPISSLNGRLYFEAKEQLNENTKVRFWIEYSPNFTNPNDWLLNFEPSLTSTVYKNVSLRISYLVKYQNLRVPPDVQQKDTTLTTAFVFDL